MSIIGYFHIRALRQPLKHHVKSAVYPDFINNLGRGFFQEFIQNNKKYQSWEEVKQALAGVMGQLKEAEFHILPDDPAEAE